MRTTRLTILAAVFILSAGSVFAADDKPLSLDAFLGQVKAQGKGYRAAAEAVEGVDGEEFFAELPGKPGMVRRCNHGQAFEFLDGHRGGARHLQFNPKNDRCPDEARAPKWC